MSWYVLATIRSIRHCGYPSTISPKPFTLNPNPKPCTSPHPCVSFRVRFLPVGGISWLQDPGEDLRHVGKLAARCPFALAIRAELALHIYGLGSGAGRKKSSPLSSICARSRLLDGNCSCEASTAWIHTTPVTQTLNPKPQTLLNSRHQHPKGRKPQILKRKHPNPEQ